MVSGRDLIREFIQWLADNRTARYELFEALDEDDPDGTEPLIAAFLEAIGEPQP